jgi:hypothetical protein
MPTTRSTRKGKGKKADEGVVQFTDDHRVALMARLRAKFARGEDDADKAAAAAAEAVADEAAAAAAAAAASGRKSSAAAGRLDLAALSSSSAAAGLKHKGSLSQSLGALMGAGGSSSSSLDPATLLGALSTAAKPDYLRKAADRAPVAVALPLGDVSVHALESLGVATLNLTSFNTSKLWASTTSTDVSFLDDGFILAGLNRCIPFIDAAVGAHARCATAAVDAFDFGLSLQDTGGWAPPHWPTGVFTASTLQDWMTATHEALLKSSPVPGADVTLVGRVTTAIAESMNYQFTHYRHTRSAALAHMIAIVSVLRLLYEGVYISEWRLVADEYEAYYKTYLTPPYASGPSSAAAAAAFAPSHYKSFPKQQPKKAGSFFPRAQGSGGGSGAGGWGGSGSGGGWGGGGSSTAVWGGGAKGGHPPSKTSVKSVSFYLASKPDMKRPPDSTADFCILHGEKKHTTVDCEALPVWASAHPDLKIPAVGQSWADANKCE